MALTPLQERIEARRKNKLRSRWKRRSEQDKVIGAKIKRKTVFRIKAADQRGHDVFFKTRTKKPITTIKRLLARQNLTEKRITI